ncbi:hypothetical protein ABT112_27625 [Streptomyces sp. NPDC002055]|uniref:hypothetical protein n=1 Tax=Streptomyces sp. NPDC002055 TaxID=3154534 RepID=UPI00331DA1C2
MKKALKGLSVGSVALACVLVSGTEALAAEGHGARYGGCRNYIKVWRSGGKVVAQGKMICNQRVSIMRPDAALSSYKNGSLQDVTGGGLHGCHRAKKCYSKKVSLKAHKGWKYHATNIGTASLAGPNQGDMVWPRRTNAKVWYKVR